jgi:hypothetical protein
MLKISQNFETNKCFVIYNVRTMKDLDLPTQKIDVEKNLVQNHTYIKKAKLKGLIPNWTRSTQSTRFCTLQNRARMGSSWACIQINNELYSFDEYLL